MLHSYHHLYFFITILFFISVPTIVFGAEIRLDATKKEIRVNEEFIVSVIVHTNEPINAVEGQVTFSHDVLDLKGVHDGNSSINLWIEKPHVTAPGRITFSGITPGGFVGANQLLFSIVFKSKQVGTGVLMLKSGKILKNDGVGTEATLTVRNTTVVIKPGDSVIRTEKIYDTEPPEDFQPSVMRDSTIFDNAYYIIFSTQDKKLGIKEYKIREGDWGRFIHAESPYLLEHQALGKTIFIKAIDYSGNERVIMLLARNQLLWYQNNFVRGILILIVILCVLLIWKRFTL